MIPLPVNPNIVLLVNSEGAVERTANNVSNDLKVIVAKTPEEFEELSKGVTYRGTVSGENS